MFSTKYKKYNFNQITVNSWKDTCKNNNTVFNKAGRSNLLGENLIKKVKDTAIGTRAAVGVMNRKQILSMVRRVARANDPNALCRSMVKLYI